MKKFIIAIFICLPIFWQSCIEDDSVGIIRSISDIEIGVEKDSFYADFGNEFVIPVEVSQSKELELTYEWSVVKEKKDEAMKVVCSTPEFRYTFDELGEFRVRLKVSNQDGSAYHFFKIFVQTPYEEGLLVLSEDEHRVGRSSFLRVKKHPDEIVVGDGVFATRVFEKINPEFPLEGIKDMTWYEKKVYLLAGDGTKIHVYDRQSFDYINTYNVGEENPGLRLRCFSQSVPPFSMGKTLMIGEEGGTWIFDYNLSFLMPDLDLFADKKFDKLYAFSNQNCNVLLVNFEESYICHQFLGQWPCKPYNSGNDFSDRTIVNLVADNEKRLRVITTDPGNPLSVRMTKYGVMSEFSWSIFGFTGAFLEPKNTEYQADEPLTLTRETDMLTNPSFYVTYYTRGGELYEWAYSGTTPKLPKDPVLTVEGEITCMCLNPDSQKKYLYLGVWNPSAQEELKGSLYIMDASTRKVIKEYRGIADKPLKIMYKPIDDYTYN